MRSELQQKFNKLAVPVITHILHLRSMDVNSETAAQSTYEKVADEIWPHLTDEERQTVFSELAGLALLRAICETAMNWHLKNSPHGEFLSKLTDMLGKDTEIEGVGFIIKRDE